MEGIPQQIIKQCYSTSIVSGAHGTLMCRTEAYPFLLELMFWWFYTVLLKGNLLNCVAKKYQ